MNTKATQSGAEGETPAPATPKPSNARLEAMAKVSATIQAQRAAVEEEDAGTVKSFMEELENSLATDPNNQLPEPEAKKVAPAEKDAVSNEPQAPVFQDEAGNWKMRVKVNGKTEEVPVESVQTSYQKDAAGSQKLQRAAARQQELDRREQQIRAAEQAVIQRAKQAPSQPSKDAVPLSKMDEEFAAAIYSGDESSVTAAMAKYRETLQASIEQKVREGTPQHLPIDPDAIAAQVQKRIDFTQAHGEFTRDYADVLADPVLTDLADRESDRLLREEPELSFAENLTKSGNRAREWLASKLPSRAKTDPVEVDPRRLERKRETANSSGGTARTSTSAPPPVTTSSVIAEMKKARGQIA